MSLFSHVRVQPALQNGHAELVQALRSALYDEMGTGNIARLVRADAAQARREIEAVLDVALHSRQIPACGVAEGERAKQDVLDMIFGLGPIEHLLSDPSVTEIMVNAPDSVFFERDGCLYPSDVTFFDDDQIRLVIDRIISPLGRRVDEQSPMVSARLPEGHRVNAVIPPLAVDGPVLTIRKFRETVFSLDELIEFGTIDHLIAQLLAWAVRARCNIAVSGGTGGGKTTLLNTLSCQIDPAERVITIEDAAELRFSHHPHVVRLEARPANTEGRGAVTVRDLMTNALRMRPDRIIIGECRGGEALDMLQAMNTGHPGSMTTLHAGTPEEAVARLVMMSRYASDLPVAVIEQQIATALDLIVQQDRFPDGSRHVTAISSCSGGVGGVRLEPVVTYDRSMSRHVYHHAPVWLDELPVLGIATSEEVLAWKREAGCA
jgi:pilus assembly protein CpaF